MPHLSASEGEGQDMSGAQPWAWAEALSTLGMGLGHTHGREGWKDLIGARDTHGKKLMERVRGCREGA